MINKNIDAVEEFERYYKSDLMSMLKSANIEPSRDIERVIFYAFEEGLIFGQKQKCKDKQSKNECGMMIRLRECKNERDL